ARRTRPRSVSATRSNVPPGPDTPRHRVTRHPRPAPYPRPHPPRSWTYARDLRSTHVHKSKIAGLVRALGGSGGGGGDGAGGVVDPGGAVAEVLLRQAIDEAQRASVRVERHHAA